MRIARFAADGRVSYGLVGAARDDGPEPGEVLIAELAGHPFGPGPDPSSLTGVTHRLAGVRLLAPVLPSKVIAIGRNYAEHAREQGVEPPSEPVLFLKPSTAVCGPSDPIALPAALSQRVDYEGELAVVIGRMCRQATPEQAGAAILGYTCGNDVTARDLQARDGQWARAKGFDTFCPLGPWIETDMDAADAELTTAVNGAVRQRARTSEMVHAIPALVAFVSAVMTLLPGDVLLTGTPAGVGPLADGDEVTVTIEGIGALTNPVVSDK